MESAALRFMLMALAGCWSDQRHAGGASPGPTAVAAGRRDRHVRHDSPMASVADRPQVDVREGAAPSAWRRRRDSATCDPDGRGESDVGLYPDPRRSEESRTPRWAIDDCSGPQSAGHPARAGATDVVATFLRAHWGAIAGADFFTTEVWTWLGLVTYYTIFVIDLASRRVHVVGSTPHPDEGFMRQRRPRAHGHGRRCLDRPSGADL
jgi:hypothetical protein